MVIYDQLANLRENYYFRIYKYKAQAYTIKMYSTKLFETLFNYKEVFSTKKYIVTV